MSVSVNSSLSNAAAGMAGATLTVRNTAPKKTGVGSFSKSSSTKSKKKLNYNSREISAQLMRAKKARNASNVLASAKTKVSTLQRCLGTGQYDDGEVRIAITHAKRMVKAAQMKVRNLKEEESQQRKYERKKSSEEQQKKSEVKRRVHQKEQELAQKVSIEEMQQVQREKERRLEMAKRRRMHRNQEQNKISEADMRYLQETINYMHNTGGVDGTAVSIDLSDVAVLMSELQLSEAQLQQLEQEVELEVEASMPEMGGADLGAAMSVSSVEGQAAADAAGEIGAI